MMDVSRLSADERAKVRNHVLAQVGHAIWTASQHVPLSELERFVVGTVNDIRSDAP